ncbi:MAG: ATP-binding protein [Oscillospiraceae bacterium]|nr:ATP-binding protein [Oscillospiraceae bacterium]
MLREQIFAAAMNRIEDRRLRAQHEQERRTDEIMQKIPEAVTLERQLRSVCLSVMQIADGEKRAERLRQIQKQSEDANGMMRKLLLANGFPEDYLDTHYSCENCSDSGFVNGERCACLQHEIAVISAEQMNARSRLSLCSFESFSLRYYDDLPKEERSAMQRVFGRCRQYAEEFDPAGSGNLLMIGGTGLGKTHLSLSIASVLLEKGFSVIYDSVGSLLHTLEQEHFHHSEASGDTLETLLDCDLLILDDFGTEFDTSFSRSALYTVLNSRINAGKAMIVNTNLSSSEIQESYGDRILSRLLSSEILLFYGKDIRLKKRHSRAHTGSTGGAT